MRIDFKNTGIYTKWQGYLRERERDRKLKELDKQKGISAKNKDKSRKCINNKGR